MRRALPLILALLAPAAASASVALALSVEDLTSRAELVVRGRVVAQQAAWTRAGRIVTTATVEVAERLKGASDATVAVRHLGGRVGDVGQQVAGEVGFTDGEEVVLFLRRTPLQGVSYQVVGMAQGKFSVDRTLAVPAAGQDLKGLGTVGSAGGPVREGAGERLTLDSLRARVLAAAGRAP